MIHLNKEEIAEDFVRIASRAAAATARSSTVPDLVAEARAVLREKFLAADVGITGANLLIAETGSSVIVTNEGNGDLDRDAAAQCISSSPRSRRWCRRWKTPARSCALLARSGTGQEITTYTTFATGPARDGDPDGPAPYHVVLLDNGRSEMLGGDFQDMLRCIRCGACLNHCPVYGAIGGHAYGSLYPGPMGAVLTPALYGIDHARDLPNASSFCGRCEEVCPMAIPLPVDDAEMAGARFRARRSTFSAATRAEAMGVRGEAPAPLSRAWQDRSRRCSPGSRGTVVVSVALPFAQCLDRHARSAGAARQDLP